MDSKPADNDQTRTNNRSQPQPEPNFHCEKCDRVDSTLRVTVIWRVTSFISISRRTPKVKILCNKCRVKETLAANVYTVFLGWWSFYGFFWTLETLFDNGTGGELPKGNNAALLRALSYQLYKMGNHLEAYKALKAAQKFQPEPESGKILEQLGRNVHKVEQENFWRKFRNLELHPFYYHAPVGVCLFFLFCLGLYTIGVNSDTGLYPPAQRPTPSYYSSANPSTAAAVTPVFSEPEKTLPDQGVLSLSANYFIDTNQTAPFKITTPSDGNYVMKIEDWNTKDFVAIYFIPRSSTLSIDLPLGSYRLKFAQGDKWYGTNYLFGPTTAYSFIPNRLDFVVDGDYVRGHQIELIPQVNGNLETPAMSPKDW